MSRSHCMWCGQIDLPALEGDITPKTANQKIIKDPPHSANKAPVS